MLLGAGRDKASDLIDPGVGITVRAKPGEPVNAGDAVLELRFRTERFLADAAQLAASAFVIADTPPASFPLIVDEIV
jgi:thymidine phosphorylase